MPKRVTAKQVAELAGVSRTTVSFVMNNVPGRNISKETCQRVLDVARKLNYYPDATARRMAMGQTKVIGFALRQNSEQSFVDLFLQQILNGASQVSREKNYHVIFEPVSLDEDASINTRLIHERHVDGIVASFPRFDDKELMRLNKTGAKIVLIGQIPDTDIPFVDVDNVKGALKATDHLIKLGHQRIGLITNAPTIYTASATRLEGYRQALETAGITFDETLIRYGDYTPESGFLAMEELLDIDLPPTAVFVASDSVALGAMHAIHQRNLQIPGDMAVVGYDDVPLARFLYPPLTTIRLPAYDLGRAAADMLIGMLNTEESTKKPPGILLDTELVIRETCGFISER